MLFIKIALIVSAAYAGGTWLAQLVGFLRNLDAYRASPDAAGRLEAHTFHLGLCFILAIGFLGLILIQGA